MMYFSAKQHFMENLPTHPHQLRPLKPEECRRLAQFVQEHAEGNFVVSDSFAYHYASSIFVNENEAGDWQGVLVSWKSPSVYNTAVVEGLAVVAPLRGRGIGAALLRHTMDYWRNHCVLNLQAILIQATERAKGWFIKEGFELRSNAGVEFFFKRMLPEKICMQNRRMRPRMNTVNGQVSEDTLFEYFQDGDVVWATYHGGDVLRGMIIGRMSPNLDLDIRYLQLGVDGTFHEGTSHSSTEFLNDGRIVLYEDWIWTGNCKGSGTSIIEEIKE